MAIYVTCHLSCNDVKPLLRVEGFFIFYLFPCICSLILSENIGMVKINSKGEVNIHLCYKNNFVMIIY